MYIWAKNIEIICGVKKYCIILQKIKFYVIMLAQYCYFAFIIVK